MPLTRRDLAAVVPALAPTAAAAASDFQQIWTRESDWRNARADNPDTPLPPYLPDVGEEAQAAQRAIPQARTKAHAQLGGEFDIRAFHDTVLQLGSVPLPVLKRRIDRFIADGGPSPYAADA